MKGVISTLTWAALAVVALAQPKFTMNSVSGIENGKPFQLTWSDAAGPVTINLKTGASTDLKTYQVIVAGASGTTFTWTPNIPAGPYSLEIIDGTTPNYVGPFTVSGTPTGSVSAPASSSTGSASASASRSSSASSAATTSAASTSAASSSAASSGSTSSRASSTSSGSSSAASSTRPTTSATPPPNNGAGSLAAPIVAPFLLLAGLAVF